MNLAVCGLVRNAAVNLQANLNRLEELRPFCKDMKIFIVENDSTDNTVEVLETYQATKPNVFIDSRTLHQDPFKSGPFSMHRITLMSKYRNIYLEKLKEWPETDFVLILDFDIYHFDPGALLNAMQTRRDWDKLSAFGSNYVDYHLFPVFYDIFAYMDHSNQGLLKHYFTDFSRFRILQRELYLKMKNSNDLVPVMSNFNGLAIYRYAAVTCGAVYAPEACNMEGIESYCEHAVFHKELIQNSFDRLYIDPKLRVIYEKPNWALHLKKYVFYKLDYYARKIYGNIYPLFKKFMKFIVPRTI